MRTLHGLQRISVVVCFVTGIGNDVCKVDMMSHLCAVAT